MASLITSVSHGNYPQQPRTAYITTANYSNVFFSYTTSLNASYVTVGSLTTVSGVNSSNTPAGDYLYANGKKLYPGANPGISSFLVGVYSPTSGLNGYIDPNGSVFSPLHSGKPYQTQVQSSTGDYVYNADNSGVEDSGVPVRTNGSVLATTGLGYQNNTTSYATGEQTNNATSIVSTINTPTGLFTAYNQGILGTGAKNSFLMYNSSLGANDVLVTNISSSVAANIGLIGVNSYVVAASTALISIVNLGVGSLTTGDTPAIRFMTLKSL
jgi:hypothetical protein